MTIYEGILDVSGRSDILLVEQRQFLDTLSEDLELTDLAERIGSYLTSIAEGVEITDTLLFDHVMVLVETIHANDTLTSIATMENSIIEGAVFTDSVSIALYLLLTEQVDLTDSLTDGVLKLIQLIEALQFLEVLDSNHNATVIAAEAIGIYDTLERFFEAILSESLDINDLLIHNLLAAHLMVDALIMTDTVAASAAFYFIQEELIEVTDTLELAQILQAALSEGIIFVTSFDLGGHTYTGWCMNSENFAVSTYSNYDFNSLIEADGQYYGAKTDGIYLLEGLKDETDYITATIRTGKLDFETSNLKNVNQAYIGFTGTGDIVLKVIVDQDIETWYNLTSTKGSIHTDRVSLAKGPQGRYWQFELVTQDHTEFELDTLELFPIILKRKV